MLYVVRLISTRHQLSGGRRCKNGCSLSKTGAVGIIWAAYLVVNFTRILATSQWHTLNVPWTGTKKLGANRKWKGDWEPGAENWNMELQTHFAEGILHNIVNEVKEIIVNFLRVRSVGQGHIKWKSTTTQCTTLEITTLSTKTE